MIRLSSNYILKNRQLSQCFSRSFTKKSFSDEYLKGIKEDLSDFQNTFGFDEVLRQKRLESIRQEKKLMRTFNVFGIMIASVGKLLYFTLILI